MISLVGHPMLSDAAARLPHDVLAAHVAVADALLSVGSTVALSDAAGSGQDGELARVALALQVSHQVAGGMDADLYTSVSRGARSFAFRGSAAVSQRARAIAARLLPGWRIAGSLR
jgi:hypothetical protein